MYSVVKSKKIELLFSEVRRAADHAVGVMDNVAPRLGRY